MELVDLWQKKRVLNGKNFGGDDKNDAEDCGREIFTT
jgi:hypothetical protein